MKRRSHTTERITTIKNNNKNNNSRLTCSLLDDWPSERSRARQLLSRRALCWLCCSSSPYTRDSCPCTWTNHTAG